jgi:transposase
MVERTFLGLDVHARSVWAGVLDGVSGEVVSRAAPVRVDALVGWVLGLPAPVAVAYEAGPTGFGLARALGACGVRCVVCGGGAESDRAGTGGSGED